MVSLPPGFPLLQTINHERLKLYNSYKRKYPATAIKPFLLHKLLSIICLPANFTISTLCFSGFIVTSCTLGTVKVAIYAASLTTCELKFHSGAEWCFERFLHSFWHFGKNIKELILDSQLIAKSLASTMLYVAHKIHLGKFLLPVFQFFNHVSEKMKASGKLACTDEQNSAEICFLSHLQVLERMTHPTRIQLTDRDRPISMIMKHYAFSLINFPINLTIATIASITALVLSVAFIAKIIFQALTDHRLMTSTYLFKAGYIAGISFQNTALDLLSALGDGLIVLYKGCDLVGITKIFHYALHTFFHSH